VKRAISFGIRTLGYSLRAAGFARPPRPVRETSRACTRLKRSRDANRRRHG